MAQVVWTQQALADADALHDSIARDSLHFAKLFVTRVLASTDHRALFPRSGRVVPERERDDVLDGDRISVITVHHAARHLGDLSVP